MMVLEGNVTKVFCVLFGMVVKLGLLVSGRK
jgi:hypothetical protein